MYVLIFIRVESQFFVGTAYNFVSLKRNQTTKMSFNYRIFLDFSFFEKRISGSINLVTEQDRRHNQAPLLVRGEYYIITDVMTFLLVLKAE